jgi:hypothetical protein
MPAKPASATNASDRREPIEVSMAPRKPDFDREKRTTRLELATLSLGS